MSGLPPFRSWDTPPKASAVVGGVDPGVAVGSVNAPTLLVPAPALLVPAPAPGVDPGVAAASGGGGGGRNARTTVAPVGNFFFFDLSVAFMGLGRNVEVLVPFNAVIYIYINI